MSGRTGNRSARRIALETGAKTYQAVPCVSCGSRERYTKDRSCMNCRALRGRRDRALARASRREPSVIAAYPVSCYDHNEIAPCDACPNQGVCRSRLVACADFATYQRSGRVVMGDRRPTREVYASLFAEEVA